MFTVISQETFNDMQLNAGVLLNSFNPASPAAPSDNDIICATTGGISASCVPKYTDFFADVDNAPENTKEGKHLDGWDCKMSFTSLGATAEGIRMALGAADITAATSKITPRGNLASGDFADIWWVGDRADGGLVAIKLKNALSTSGFSLKTTKNGKGQLSVELTGHVSISAQNVIPMEFYSKDPSTVTYTAATLTAAGFAYGTKYYTRSGAGTADSPYVYSEIADDAVYDSSKTYYVKSYT